MNLVPLTSLVMLAAATVGLAAEENAESPVVVTYREQITNFWGERDVKLHLVVSAKEAFAGELQWSLQAAGRSLVSRSSPIEVAAGGQSVVEVRYALPAVKDAVVFPIELLVTVGTKGEAPAAELRETWYLLGTDPFVDRQRWLESLNIHLFDPEDKTAEAFDKLHIPFERITNPATIEDLREAVLIIGEGTAWKDYGELGTTLLNAAARGVDVLCLASDDAEFALSATNDDKPAKAHSLSFRQTDAIHDLDKRLSLQWTGEHSVVHRSISLVAENDRVLVRAGEPASGWPWMEKRFPQQAKKSSALVWCGLGLIRSWDDSPTPRYILLRWLEKLTQQRSRQAAEESQR